LAKQLRCLRHVRLAGRDDAFFLGHG
jgi:hypothetical protein